MWNTNISFLFSIQTQRKRERSIQSDSPDLTEKSLSGNIDFTCQSSLFRVSDLPVVIPPR